MIKQNILKKIFLVSLCTLSCIKAEFDESIPDALAAYGILMGSVVAHEAGHAYAIKQLYNEDCELNVGAYSPDVNASTLFKVGNVNFQFPLLPAGYVKYRNRGKNHLNDVAIGLSGPIAGSLSGLASYLVLNMLFPKPYSFISSKSISAGVTLGHLFNFIPYPGLDGDLIYKSFKKWWQERKMMEEAKQKRQARLKKKN